MDFKLLHDGTLCRPEDAVSEKRLYAALRYVQAEIYAKRLLYESDGLFDERCTLIKLLDGPGKHTFPWSYYHEVQMRYNEKRAELNVASMDKTDAWHLMQKLGGVPFPISYRTVLGTLASGYNGIGGGAQARHGGRPGQAGQRTQRFRTRHRGGAKIDRRAKVDEHDNGEQRRAALPGTFLARDTF